MIHSPASPPSRRELNKAATREAIVHAAFDQLEGAGFAALTAESVADAAGISRRTFFNYFPSIEAALNAPTKLLLENAVAVLDEVDPRADLLSATVTTVESLVDPALLEPIAKLYLLAAQHPQMARMQLEAWNDCAQALTALIMARAPHGTVLASTVFAQCVIGAGKAAFDHWSRQLTGAPDPRDPRRTELLRATLAEAVAQLRDGFPSLQQRAPQMRKS